MSIKTMFKQREQGIPRANYSRSTSFPASHKPKEYPRMSDNYDFDKLERNLKRAVEEFKENPRVRRLGAYNNHRNTPQNHRRRDMNGNR